METVLKAISDWIKSLLTAAIMSNLSGLFDDVNTQVGNIAQQVGTKPSNFEPRVFAMIEALSRNVVLPIALWLKSQSTYQIQAPAKEVPEEVPLKLQRPKSGKYYSFQEIQDFYNISRTTLIKWIRTENIPTIDVGRAKRVRKDVFDDVLRLKRNVEEDT